MKRNSKWLYVVFAVAMALASCNRKTIYHHYEHTSLSGWEKNDTLNYLVPSAKLRAVAQRDVEVRISGDYPFRNLFLMVEQTTYPSNIRRRDTLNCELVTPDGSYKTRGVTFYQYRFPLTDISINEGDSLCIRIRHNMKREILPGIADIGIRLTAY